MRIAGQMASPHGHAANDAQDPHGVRYKEVKPKDFVKLFRALLGEERSPTVAKKILMDIAKKNGGREGLYDMFIKRPNSLSRILESKTIDGEIVVRLRFKMSKWIVDEEEKKKRWLASTLLIQRRIRGVVARARFQLMKQKKKRDALEFRSAAMIQKYIRRKLSARRFEEYKKEAYFQQPKKRTWKYLELADVVKMYHANGNKKKGNREVLLVQPKWGGNVVGATVDPESDVYSTKTKMHLNDKPQVVIQHYGISNDRLGRLEPRVVALYKEGMVIPGPPFWWPLTWQRYMEMAQVGKKPGQQKEERVGIFEVWEQQKQFILTKEPRWLGGALVRYLRDRGELPAEDHDVAKEQKRHHAHEARVNARMKRVEGRKSYLDMTLKDWEKDDPVLSTHPGRDIHFGLLKTLPKFRFPNLTRGLRIVFLEDDGVLNTDKSAPGEMEDEFIERCRKMYYATGCYFVCCSPRRLTPDLMKEFTDRFVFNGVPAQHILGGTPLLPGNKYAMWRRIDECLMWLKDQVHIEIESWIVIDKNNLARLDFDPFYCDLEKHWVRTHLRKGLNEERLAESIRLLLLPVLDRKEELEQKLTYKKRKFEEKLQDAYDLFAEEDPFSVGLKPNKQIQLLHVFEDTFSDLLETLDQIIARYEILLKYLKMDTFLKSKFSIQRTSYPKLVASLNKVSRGIQKMEGNAKKAKRLKDEKSCYEAGGRKCINPGCLGLCLPTKNKNGKKSDYVTCPIKTCEKQFCRLCGVPASPITTHGQHRHLEICEFYDNPGPLRDVFSPLYLEQDKEVVRGMARIGTVKCLGCHDELEKRKAKGKAAPTTACRLVKKLPKNWLDTKILPQELKTMKSKLRTWEANQKRKK